jgi:hypothetical protein
MMNTVTFSRSRFWLIACLFLGPVFSYSQTIKDVFSSKETPMLYLGIDFTKAKLIGDETTSTSDIRDREFLAINGLVVEEPKKFKLDAAFRKNNIDHDLSLVEKRNEKINADQIKSSSSADFHRLKPEDINALVAGFDFGDKKGIGILFVMEGMDKMGKAAAIWVTLIDMRGKKVLLTDRVEGKTGMSFGFRNFWATAVHSVIENIDKKKYKEWQQKYQ